MKLTEINIAIAEACGWTKCVCGDENCGAWFPKDSETAKLLPNYYGDLNACHEMEKVLTYDATEENPLTDWDRYRIELAANGLDSCIHAPAPQKCEAFLKTLGKWKP